MVNMYCLTAYIAESFNEMQKLSQQLQNIITYSGETTAEVVDTTLKMLLVVQDVEGGDFDTLEGQLKAASRKPVHRLLLSIVRKCIVFSPNGLHELLFTHLNQSTAWVILYAFSMGCGKAIVATVEKMICATDLRDLLTSIVKALVKAEPEAVMFAVEDLWTMLTAPDCGKPRGTYLKQILKILPTIPELVMKGQLGIPQNQSLVEGIGQLYQAEGSPTVEELVTCVTQISSSLTTTRFSFLVALCHDIEHSTSTTDELKASSRAFIAKIQQVDEINALLAPNVPYLCQLYYSKSDPYYEQWLLSIAAHGGMEIKLSVTAQLIDMDILLFECMPESPALDRQEKLIKLWKQINSDDQNAIDTVSCATKHILSSSCNAKQRILSFLSRIAVDESPKLVLERPIDLELKQDKQDITVLSRSNRYEEWHKYLHWKQLSFADTWLALVHATTDENKTIMSEAIQLLCTLPFPSLEDPQWQFTCIHQLGSAFLHAIKDFQTLNLERLKSIVATVVNFQGGVCANGSTVYGILATLLIDAIFTRPFSIAVQDGYLNFYSIETSAVKETSILEQVRSKRINTTFVLPSEKSTHVDQLRLQDLDSARSYTLHLTDLLSRVTVDAGLRGKRLNERIDYIIHLLLEKLLPTSSTIPTDDQYRDVLPNRSPFEIDLQIERWMLRAPGVLSVLKIITIAPTNAVRILPIIKSMLASLIGRWNSIKGTESHHIPPYMRRKNLLRVTLQVVGIVQQLAWIPERLGFSIDMIERIPPPHIRALLMSIWIFLSEYPPIRKTPVDIQLEPYFDTLRSILHANIDQFGPVYSRY